MILDFQATSTPKIRKYQNIYFFMICLILKLIAKWSDKH
jgi:hypothetical protein